MCACSLTSMAEPRRRRLALHWKILIGLALGVVVGLILNQQGPAIQEVASDSPFLRTLFVFLVSLNRLIAQLFTRSLQFIAVPIILFALILAIGSLGDLRKLGRLGGKTVGIFACTATLSVIVGLALVNLIAPGGPAFISDENRERIVAATASQSQRATELATTAKSTDPWLLVRDIVPTNPFDSLARADMLQVVFFALIVGIALNLLPREKSQPVLDVVDGLAEVFTAIVRWIIRTAPVGVFCLIVPVVAGLGFDVLFSLGAYCVTVLVGLAIIQFVIYPAVVRVFSSVTVREFFRGIAEVQLVAFSSSSSAATLPVTIRNVRDKLGVPADITGFVCAMGVKINMDGTALMQAVAAVFLSQAFPREIAPGQFAVVPLTLPEQVSLVVLAIVSAIGTPGIPSGGMVMLIVVLRTYGVPAEGIAMILAVDRILDMCRTVVNVTGDAAVAVAVAGTEGVLKKPKDA